MKKISLIGSHLKKIYRLYSVELLERLQERGFLDLRPSFLEILMYLCDSESPSIKDIGVACGLKKQTMTSHLNELEKRGYIIRKTGAEDRREQKVFLTDYGHKFKLTLMEVVSELEIKYIGLIGSVEMDRVVHILENFYNKIKEKDEAQQKLL